MTVLQGLDVPPTIAAIAAAVQQGEFAEAEQLGRQASLPLSIPKHCLKLGDLISEGAQASVFRARYTSDNNTSPADVAVKRPRIRESSDLERFRAEVGLLARLQHPAIVTLLGARLVPPEYSMVMGLEATNAATQVHDAGWRPSWHAVALLGAQLAGALAHMHQQGVVHRDVKPANLLLDDTRSRLRLADLGLALTCAELAGAGETAGKPSGGFHKQHMVGTLEYLPPEVLLGGRHSPAADIYALGVTLAELGTGTFPFSDATRDNPLAHTVLEMGYGRQELAAAVAAEGLRPILPPSTPEAARKLLEACWAHDPSCRPAAADMATALQQLAAELQEEGSCADSEMADAGASSEDPSPLSSPPRSPSAYPPTAPSPVTVLRVRPKQLHWKDAVLAVVPDPAEQVVPSFVPVAGEGGTPGVGVEISSAPPPPFPASRWGGDHPPAWLQAALQQEQQHAQHTAVAGTQPSMPPPAVAGFASAGPRGADRMEDRHVILRDVGGWRGVTVCGVFDGHRGAETAEYLASNLEAHLAARWHSAHSAGELLTGALWDADVAFRAQQDAEWARRVAAVGSDAAGPRRFPGATAALVLVAGGLLAAANLGDSRAVLCRGGQAVDLTADQTAEREDERRRVQAAGGLLRHVAGGWRVGQAGMQVTRSVGDADLKSEGVTAEAEVSELPLSPTTDAFLLLATDGVWEQLGSGDAVALVRDTVKQPAMCAQRLVTEALARGSRDNLTAVVAVFPGGGAAAGGGAAGGKLVTREQVFFGGGGAAGVRGARQGGRKVAAPVQLAPDELADAY